MSDDGDMAWNPPTIDDARRAAEALWREGVGRVLVFGSVARGDTRRYSDIDLLAVLASADDLDCDVCHGRFQNDLSYAAQEAVGYRVDVVATDAPTWAARSPLPFALESAIAADAVELFDRLDPSEIDWDKQIELPLTALGEALLRLESLGLTLGRWWSIESFHRRGDTPGGEASARTVGWALSAVRSAARVAHVHRLQQLPPHSGDTRRLIATLPDPERHVWQRLAAPAFVDPDDADPDDAQAAARAALALAAYVTDQLEAEGADADALGECGDRQDLSWPRVRTCGADTDALTECRSSARELAETLNLA
ncbi:nucleotidyltransferase family protein [Candidatus Poriferisodalis sp.]|uniref:nucleotidyltransferase family protein n=1 Tax=Candidatus Poriferisodalis sp. TaxID=3101277 RepID=UPI003B01A852